MAHGTFTSDEPFRADGHDISVSQSIRAAASTARDETTGDQPGPEYGPTHDSFAHSESSARDAKSTGVSDANELCRPACPADGVPVVDDNEARSARTGHGTWRVSYISFRTHSRTLSWATNGPSWTETVTGPVALSTDDFLLFSFRLPNKDCEVTFSISLGLVISGRMGFMSGIVSCLLYFDSSGLPLRVTFYSTIINFAARGLLLRLLRPGTMIDFFYHRSFIVVLRAYFLMTVLIKISSGRVSLGLHFGVSAVKSMLFSCDQGNHTESENDGLGLE
jgi:hypothetical protein